MILARLPEEHITTIADAIIVVSIIAAFCFFGWLFFKD